MRRLLALGCMALVITSGYELADGDDAPAHAPAVVEPAAPPVQPTHTAGATRDAAMGLSTPARSAPASRTPDGSSSYLAAFL